MDQLILAGVLVVVAVVAAVLLARRKPDPPTQPTVAVPAQLDRADFDRPDSPWLVVVFSSASCAACAGTAQKAAALGSEAVAVQDVAYQEHGDLHRRYAIDAVPLVLIADAEGVVRGSFVGEPTATDLWATVADLREPGSVPPGCDHGAGGD